MLPDPRDLPVNPDQDDTLHGAGTVPRPVPSSSEDGRYTSDPGGYGDGF